MLDGADHNGHVDGAVFSSSTQTPWREVDLADEAAVAAAVDWWEELTAAGGEGVVVKPLPFVAAS